jgi:hypothetical protein
MQIQNQKENHQAVISLVFEYNIVNATGPVILLWFRPTIKKSCNLNRETIIEKKSVKKWGGEKKGKMLLTAENNPLVKNWARIWVVALMCCRRLRIYRQQNSSNRTIVKTIGVTKMKA